MRGTGAVGVRLRRRGRRGRIGGNWSGTWSIQAGPVGRADAVNTGVAEGGSLLQTDSVECYPEVSSKSGTVLDSAAVKTTGRSNNGSGAACQQISVGRRWCDGRDEEEEEGELQIHSCVANGDAVTRDTRKRRIGRLLKTPRHLPG